LERNFLAGLFTEKWLLKLALALSAGMLPLWAGWPSWWKALTNRVKERGGYKSMGTMGRWEWRFMRILAELFVIWLIFVDLVELTRSLGIVGIA